MNKKVCDRVENVNESGDACNERLVVVRQRKSGVHSTADLGEEKKERRDGGGNQAGEPGRARRMLYSQKDGRRLVARERERTFLTGQIAEHPS